MEKEEDQFLDEIQEDTKPEEEDAFAYLDNQEEETPDETPEESDEEAGEEGEEARGGDLSPKNRRERRLMSRLEKEREASIQLAAEKKAMVEARKALEEGEGEDYINAVERIYGTASPEAQMATDLLKDTLRKVHKHATEDAIATIREERQAEQAKVREEEQALNSMMEDIEDEHDIDFSTPSGKRQQKSFLKLLEKMSPKDENGDVIQYADHNAIWELHQSQKKTVSNTKAKELASRSMHKTSGNADISSVKDAHESFLKKHGII